MFLLVVALVLPGLEVALVHEDYIGAVMPILGLLFILFALFSIYKFVSVSPTKSGARMSLVFTIIKFLIIFAITAGILWYAWAFYAFRNWDGSFGT